jgi:hypothetical protein
MLETVLESPSFLYREELGQPDPSLPANVVRLTDDEVASELSFLIAGSIPDAQLSAAAASGLLKTADQIKSQAVRLLATPAAKPEMRTFLHMWMNTQNVAGVNKDPMVYPELSSAPGLGNSMHAELDQFFDSVLWTGTGSLRELLTSTQSFIDSNLATLIYKMPAPAAAGMQPVQLDPATRKGVLTRSGVLARNADADNSGPVARGVFVMRSLLCSPPPPPPAGVNTVLPPFTPATVGQLTTRKRLDNHMTNPQCVSCHRLIDGIGFGFEQFDAMGVYRTTDNGAPVDPSGDLLVGDVQGAFVGVNALEDKLLQSNQVLGCVVKQFYRYALGVSEADATTGVIPVATQALLASLQKGFTQDSHLTDALMAIATAPAFFLRTTAQPKP